MKKLLLLGGARYIIPVIKKAHDLGIYTITCDYLPNNIAHKFSDEYWNISIVEKDKVLAAAENAGIDGVMSFACDPGVVTAAYVAERLGLPFQCGYEEACILQDKGRFRDFLINNNFNSPHARKYTNLEQAYDDVNYFDWPVIVKPVDSAGSKGVTKVESVDELEAAVETALKSSRIKSFIIEDFISFDGFHSDSDILVIDGKLEFIACSDQMFDCKASNPYTPAFIIWPSSMKQIYQKEFENELQRLIDILNIRTGLFNVELCVGSNGIPYIMEVSPRGGGCKIAEIQQEIYGIDFIEYEVKKAVGLHVENVGKYECQGSWCEMVIHSDTDTEGIFNCITIDDSVKSRYVRAIDLALKKGGKVLPFTGANMAIGDMFLQFETREELDRVISDVDSWLSIELD